MVFEGFWEVWGRLWEVLGLILKPWGSYLGLLAGLAGWIGPPDVLAGSAGWLGWLAEAARIQSTTSG